MDHEISGADRFRYRPPYTTIHEDAVAFLFPYNKPANVDNYRSGEGLRFPDSGHGFIEHYLNEDASGPENGDPNANRRIMEDIVAMRMRIEPRPCHGHLLGGAATTIDNLTGEEAARQLSNNALGKYVLHPSPPAATGPDWDEGPTKLVDWRGQFVDGEATEVLTFPGPAARYNGRAFYQNKVYRWGEIAYRPPDAVVGTAIQRDAKGEEWIVVVSHNLVPRDSYGSELGNTITVWRRRAKLIDYSSAVYDQSTNPYGWHEVLVAILPKGFQNGPWFFNGDGTEAASIRVADKKHWFSEREADRECFLTNEALPSGYCEPGPDGFGAAYPAGEQNVKQARVYTLSIPPPGSGGVPSVGSVPAGGPDASVVAVDYDEDGQLLLREENIATDRGYLGDPDPASADDFRWLTINGTSLTDAAALRCTVGGAPCRSARSAGISLTDGGFVGVLGDLGKEPNERVRYHLFYVDLRTRTYAFSRREDDLTEYWLVHDDQAPQLLGTEDGLPLRYYRGFVGSRYGYEGDQRNLTTDVGESVLVERDGQRVPFGTWEKVNPILGRYEPDIVHLDRFSTSPLPTFGIDVAVDGSVLASGVLPAGTTFDDHSKVDLKRELGTSLTGMTLLPIGVR